MILQSQLKITLENGVSLSYDDIELLKALKECGSIIKTAKNMKISYKTAWDALNKINKNSELFTSKKNQGCTLNEKALELINKCEQIKKAQNFLVQKMLEKNINLEYISRIPLKLSAKNQLKVKILEINESIVNTDIIATLSTNEILKAKITKSSQKELGLKVGDEVIFIFKAPSVMIKKQDFSKLILPNLIKAKITSAIIGSQNCQITALTSDKQNLTAIIPNDVTMDLRLAVNDEIGVIIDPKDIIIGI